VRAKHAQVNLHIFGPQVIVAANTFCVEPTSKIAKETFEQFCDMWRHLVNDVVQVAKEILDSFKPPHSPLLTTNHNKLLLLGNNSSSSSFPDALGGQFYREGVLGDSESAAALLSYNSSNSMGHPSRLVASSNTNSLNSMRGGARRNQQQQHLHHPGQHYLAPHHSGYSAGMGDRGHPDGMSHRGGPTDGTWGYGGGGGEFPPPYGGYRGSGGFGGGGPPGGGYIPGSGSRSGMAAARDILDMYKDVSGEENAILKHARAMLSMAQVMHNFTQGGGSPGIIPDGGGPSSLAPPHTPRKVIKTTQDFFTQAEFFAEESNRLYKLIRMFSYLVPTGEDKRVLMQIADHIPRHCGQMQLLIQLPGVGKESTFRKVDAIIKENNQIMYLIAKVVQTCFANAKKYDLDFRGISLAGSAGGGGGPGGDDSAATFGSSGGAGGGGSGSLDSGIGFGSSRRGGPPAAAAGNKRTRVSFLLY
jgi:hypothetical protein